LTLQQKTLSQSERDGFGIAKNNLVIMKKVIH